MKLALTLSTAALTFAACATTPVPVAETPVKAEPAPEKLRITNAKPFDVASCAPRLSELPTVSTESLTALLVSARPMFVECLVNPKHHTKGDVKASVKTQITDAAVTHVVAGDALTAEGKTCIDGALARLKLEKLAAGAKPVEAQLEFGLGANGQVTLGDNLANDLIGTIRLAQSSMCGCYGELGINPPPMLKAALKFSSSKPVDVKLDSSADAVALKLAACVEGTLKALTYPAVDRDIQASYDFQLINSAAATASPDAPALLKFFQLDAISGQANADALLAFARRSAVSAAFEDVLERYKRKPTPGLKTERRDKCPPIVKADDEWLAALAHTKDIDAQSLATVQTLKAGDASWSQVEAQLTQKLQFDTDAVGKAEAQKTNDAAVCQKVK